MCAGEGEAFYSYALFLFFWSFFSLFRGEGRIVRT